MGKEKSREKSGKETFYLSCTLDRNPLLEPANSKTCSIRLED